MICAGIDGGSRAIKVVVIDRDTQQLVAEAVCDQGVEHDALATRLFDELLESRGLRQSHVARIVATGYTRNLITIAHSTVTEITCHAQGVRRQVPQAASIIEIGGQDAKVIRLEGDGTVRDFSMNDRCAAGTGRFLEVVAQRLGTTLDSLGDLAARAQNPAAISSTCVVFAETEIIGLLAAGARREDIVAGVQNAIASRVSAMAGRMLAPPIVFTGGVARVGGMQQALAEALRQPVICAPHPQMTGALGAAILASRQR